MKKNALCFLLIFVLSVCILTGCTENHQNAQSAQVNIFRSIDFPSEENVQKNIPNIDLKVINLNQIETDMLLSDDENEADASSQKPMGSNSIEEINISDKKEENRQDNPTANGSESIQNDHNESENKSSEQNHPGNQADNKEEIKPNNQTDNSSETTPGISPITMARAQFIMNSNPYVSKETAIYYVQLFEQYQQSIVPYMEVETLMGIARIESVYDAGAISYYAGPDGKHFLGLMQLHEDYEGIYGYGQNQLYDPACNIECACRLLKDTADRVPAYNYDQTNLICAYHQGPVGISSFDYSYSDLVYQFANQIKAMYPKN